jgi:hypothetical protein
MARGRLPRGMTPVSDIPLLLEYWNQAIASPWGIKIKPRDRWTCKTLAGRLYEARRDCGHDSYDNYKCVETDTHVWIVPR